MNVHYSPYIIQQIKNILIKHANYLIDFNEATFEEDTKHATDMTIYISGRNIALRRRKLSYFSRFGDFTIRSYCNGYRTEIHKLRDGEGDIYLFFWANENDDIKKYLLIDIEQLRKSGLIMVDRKYWDNHDGTKFFAYQIDELENTKSLLVNQT